ncbi:MAG: GTPase ObgE [Bacilli bacterium]|nr:GTPase ObgE [Bacilli bacterium]
MFIDEVILKVIAGNGGDGCTAFRREKYIPMGGPSGGNGGRGSNIIFKVDEGLRTLIDLRYQKIIRGKRGNHGEGSTRNGKNAEDVIIKVPPGTTVTDIGTNLIVADLTKHGEEAIIATGGRGGRGNKAFATHANPAPEISEYGEPGEEREIKVELKLLADVGFVGMPSVGKSTFLSVISASKPKIAAYHFTTLSPNLGVVKTRDGRSFVAADMPGLIEGASLGEGLGDQFLRHIERTRVIAHIIDMSGFEGRDPHEDYLIINKELKDFNEKISKKPMIVIANKMDIPGAKENLEKFKSLEPSVKVFEMSAIYRDGIDEILTELADMLDKIEVEPIYEESKFESHVLYKFKKEQPFKITKDSDDTWVVSGDEIEKLFRMTKFNSDDSIKRFSNKLRKMGIDDKLYELGAQEGDSVRILDYIFELKA